MRVEATTIGVFKAAFRNLSEVGLFCDSASSYSNTVMVRCPDGCALSRGEIILDFGFITSLLLQAKLFGDSAVHLKVISLRTWNFCLFGILTLNWNSRRVFCRSVKQWNSYVSTLTQTNLVTVRKWREGARTVDQFIQLSDGNRTYSN